MKGRGLELESEMAYEHGDSGIDKSQLAQALRAEIRQKDECIRRQGAEIQRLSSLIGPIRPQMICGVMQPQLEGQKGGGEGGFLSRYLQN